MYRNIFFKLNNHVTKSLTEKLKKQHKILYIKFSLYIEYIDEVILLSCCYTYNHHPKHYRSSSREK